MHDRAHVHPTAAAHPQSSLARLPFGAFPIGCAGAGARAPPPGFPVLCSSMVRGARRLPKDLVDCAQSRQRHDIANDDGALSLDGAFSFQQGKRGVDLGAAGADEQGQFAL